MNKFLLAVLGMFMVITLTAQVQTPVKWSYSAKKISTNTYEVHLTATIEKGWHTYSQTTPDGGPIPTAIAFGKNPLFDVQGATKEVGKLETHFEKLFNVDVKQFSNKVDFVQVIKLKTAAKTNVTGTVDFMVCNDEQCLPPSSQKFSIALK